MKHTCSMVSWLFSVFLLFSVQASASPVPDTGQTVCYDGSGNPIACPSPGQPFYGQDGNISINPSAYTKLDDRGNALPDSAPSWTMVKDNITGLTWEMKTNQDGVKNYSDPHDADNTYTWYDSNPATNGGDAGTPGEGTDTEDFIKALNDAGYGGYSDWRLPTDKELAYIVDYSVPFPGPTIDAGYFPNTAASWYWSGSTLAGFTDNAWLVHFDHSYVHAFFKYSSLYVRAVRGSGFSGADSRAPVGASTASVGYTDNGDGTITDTATGLMWQQAGASGMTWEQALAYCEGLDLGGHADWRLPSIKELRSLAETSRYNPSVHTTYFPDSAASWYWSGTTRATTTYDAWVVNFYFGDVDGYNKTNGYYVRAVRGGQVGAEPGIVQADLPADRVVDLVINSSNSHGDTPVFEWFPFTAVVGGHPLPIRLISDIGVFDLSQVLFNLNAYTFSFDTDDLTLFARLSMADLGLSAGDGIIYGYAYLNQSGFIIMDNIVFITVQQAAEE